jgi:predicted MFS family arabinose efflux permease
MIKIRPKFIQLKTKTKQKAQIWGNVASSTILKVKASNQTNVTLFNSHCGALDCPGGLGDDKKPNISTVYMLCGIYLALGVIGILLIVFLFDDFAKSPSERTQKKSLKSQLGLVKSVFLHLKKRNQLLIIPITMWLGFEQGFLGADFTKSFVACSHGVNYVGLTMICYGITDTIGSYGFGLIAKYVGRIPCFVIPICLNYAMLILMLTWVPRQDDAYILFIIAGCWGLADAGWQTQINSIYGLLFAETQEAAFSNFRLWESVAFALAYAYSNYLCTNVKIYLCIIYLTIGWLSYALIEVFERRETKRNRVQQTEMTNRLN